MFFTTQKHFQYPTHFWLLNSCCSWSLLPGETCLGTFLPYICYPYLWDYLSPIYYLLLYLCENRLVRTTDSVYHPTDKIFALRIHCSQWIREADLPRIRFSLGVYRGAYARPQDGQWCKNQIRWNVSKLNSRRFPVCACTRRMSCGGFRHHSPHAGEIVPN